MAESVGMKAYLLDCGYTLMDSNFMISLDTYMTSAHPDAPRRWYKCPTYCVLIKHPTVGNILFDLGSRIDTRDYAPSTISETDVYYGTPENDIVYQLALAGVKPEEIKHCIISHMHYDHIGNLSYFKDTAEFYISRKEVENACATVMTSLDVADHGFYIRNEVLADYQSIHFVEEDTELFPGIEAIMLPGHTPGLMGIVLHLVGGTVILPSDAVYGIANYNGTPPGIIEDIVGFRKSLTKVKALAKKYDGTIWFGHDGDQFDHMKKAPEYYE